MGGGARPPWPPPDPRMHYSTVAEEYKPPTLADFSPMLDISLLRWQISLYTLADFSPYAADFSSQISLLH